MICYSDIHKKKTHIRRKNVFTTFPDILSHLSHGVNLKKKNILLYSNLINSVWYLFTHFSLTLIYYKKVVSELQAACKCIFFGPPMNQYARGNCEYWYIYGTIREQRVDSDQMFIDTLLKKQFSITSHYYKTFLHLFRETNYATNKKLCMSILNVFHLY